MYASKISRNDPVLAHALAKRELHRINAVNEQAIERVYKNHRHSLKRSFKALREAFGALVLMEAVERPIGSRAKGIMLILDNAGNDPEQMLLAGFTFDARNGGLQIPVRTAVGINLHTVARTMQRSVGVADIKAVASLIGPHLCHAAKYAAHLLDSGRFPAEGDSIRIASADGVLCFKVGPAKVAPFFLLAQTWIAADTAVEPRLINAFSEVRRRGKGTLLVQDSCN